MPAEANLEWIDNIGFKIHIESFPEMITDEPVEFHGDNRGPSSVEYLMAAIGSCQGISFAYSIQKYNALIDELKVRVWCEQHHMDKHGNLSKDEGILRITKSFVKFKIKPKNKSDENLDNIDIAFRAYKKYCVVSMSIIKALPIEMSYEII
ncbi:MAG: OsmC family protein [Candidatus Helarchaeota archaeon]|nr:OsmC family protein [Candidatus Helarchaeota archaeon]